MAKGSSEAYDLSLFETVKPRLRAVNSSEKAAQMQQRKEKRIHNFHVAYTVFIVALLVAAMVYMIVLRVRVTELNDENAAFEEQLAILESEESRLRNELSAKISAESIDEYISEKGMTKTESHQIEYITVDGGDKIEVSDPAPDGIFETIGAALAGWFGG